MVGMEVNYFPSYVPPNNVPDNPLDSNYAKQKKGKQKRLMAPLAQQWQAIFSSYSILSSFLFISACWSSSRLLLRPPQSTTRLMPPLVQQRRRSSLFIPSMLVSFSSLLSDSAPYYHYQSWRVQHVSCTSLWSNNSRQFYSLTSSLLVYFSSLLPDSGLNYSYHHGKGNTPYALPPSGLSMTSSFPLLFYPFVSFLSLLSDPRRNNYNHSCMGQHTTGKCLFTTGMKQK